MTSQEVRMTLIIWKREYFFGDRGSNFSLIHTDLHLRINSTCVIRACIFHGRWKIDKPLWVCAEGHASGGWRACLVASRFLPSQNMGKFKRFGMQLVWCQNIGNSFQNFDKTTFFLLLVANQDQPWLPYLDIGLP